MEVVSEDGSKTQIRPGQTRELGRDHGLGSSDKTISRRQVSFFIPRVAENEEALTRFEVLGRNPIYVSKDNEVKIFRRFERGEMGDGDMFCVSAKNPIWYTLRKTEDGCSRGVRRNDSESELAANSERELGFEGIEDLQHESVDNSDVDPVKEFGFVVIGHEFDSYPKKMIRDIKNWDWFIEETKKATEDDDDDDDGKSGKGKRKKGPENDDDEWTGESEDDKVLINKSRNAQKPKYTTRSKDRGKSSKGSTGKSRELDDDEEEDDEDEGDETFGGFIVDDEKLDEDEEIGDEEEEVEEEEESMDEYDEDE